MNRKKTDSPTRRVNRGAASSGTETRATSTRATETRATETRATSTKQNSMPRRAEPPARATTPEHPPRSGSATKPERRHESVNAAPSESESDTAYLAGDGGLVCALFDAARAVSSEVEARAGGAKMTVAQALLARHFAHSYPGIPMAELAARSGMTAPAVTQMLQRMTQRGLVRRSESPTDGRTVLVRLTEGGEREFRAISARIQSIDRELGRRAAVNPDDLGLILSRLADSRLADSRVADSRLVRPPPR